MYTKHAYPYLPVAFIVPTLCIIGGMALFAYNNVETVFTFLVVPLVAILAVNIVAIFKGKDPKEPKD